MAPALEGRHPTAGAMEGPQMEKSSVWGAPGTFFFFQAHTSFVFFVFYMPEYSK